MADEEMHSIMRFRVTVRISGSYFQIRVGRAATSEEYAFGDVSSSSEFRIRFTRRLVVDEQLQFLLLTSIGLRARDYKAIQHVQVGLLQPGYTFHLFGYSSGMVLATLEVLSPQQQFLHATGPHRIADFDAVSVNKTSADYISLYLDVLLDNSRKWTVPELSKTHLAIWPVAVPRVIDGRSRSDLSSTIVRLPASLLVQVTSGQSVPVSYVRKLAEALSKLHGMDFSREIEISLTSTKYAENVGVLVELLGDLCTAIQLNVEYVADEDYEGASVEKIKFPEMDNFGGEDCEGVAASSYRILRILQTKFDQTREAETLPGFAQLIEFAKRYEPVLLTGSAANGPYFRMNSEMLMKSPHLINHVFCIAYPKDGQSALLTPILLEGTSQTERTFRGKVDTAKRRADHDTITRLKTGDKTRALLQNPEYEMQSSQEADTFYRYVIQWWDQSGHYLIKWNAHATFGVPFSDFMLTNPASRRSVFELVPLPEVPKEISQIAKQHVFDFIPRGFVWVPEAVHLRQIRGDLRIEMDGSRTNAASFRFQNVSQSEALLVYDAISEELGIGPSEMSLHLLVLDSPDVRPNFTSNSPKEREREYRKHFYQISVRR